MSVKYATRTDAQVKVPKQSRIDFAADLGGGEFSVTEDADVIKALWEALEPLSVPNKEWTPERVAKFIKDFKKTEFEKQIIAARKKHG